MHPDVSWPFRPVLAHLAAEGSPTSFSLKSTRHDLLAEAHYAPRPDASERQTPFDVPSRTEIGEEFLPGGAVARMYETYERRPEQVAMATQVRDAISTSTYRAIEAGTGVGKSIAYLLPEVLFAKRNNITVGVATKTNALTDQLVSHELPALAAALPDGLTFYSLKGYDHYPCLHRLDRAVLDELPLGAVSSDGRSGSAVSADMLTAIAVTYAFACQSPDGDLDALGIRWRYVPRQMLTTTPGECLRSACPYFPNECLLHGARRRAASADVVVTNHSLLLRDVMAEGRILPPVEALGHRRGPRLRGRGAPPVGHRGFWRGIQDGLRDARWREDRRPAWDHGHSSSLEGSELIVRLLTKVAASVARAQVSVGDFFCVVHDLSSIAKGDTTYDNVSIWIDEGARQTPEWAAVSEAGNVCVERLEETTKLLGEAVEKLNEVAPQQGADLTESGGFLGNLLAGIRLICAGEDTSYVYSAQLSRSRRRIGQEKLCAEKIDVGADLASRWLPEMQSVVFTSATIAVGDDFSHFDHAVGLDLLPSGEHADIRLDSSFDFDASMSVIVARDLPSPYAGGYAQALEDLLFDVHVAMGGSVLTLFTNRRDMECAYEGLGPRLGEVGLEVVCQERGSSARRIRERFMAEKSLSLLALKSFWEGFDATGDTLRCVVIPKLPFASPNNPLVRERDLREERAWWRYSLPDAVIEVKQAAGRLIRTASDTGVLVLADPRLVQKGYGKAFIKSLPSHTCATLDAKNVGRYNRDVARFTQRVGRSPCLAEKPLT